MVPTEESQPVSSLDEVLQIWLPLSRVRRYFLLASDRELSPLGTTTVQLGVLSALRDMRDSGTPPTPIEISRMINRRHNSVTTLLGRMEKQGLVHLKRNTEGTRTIYVEITAKGEDILRDTQQRIKAVPEILSTLSPDQRRQLKTLLQELDQAAQRYLKLMDVSLP